MMSNGNPHRPRPKRGRPIDETRRAAMASGAIQYRGKPCKRGHNGTRYVSTGSCVACHAVLRGAVADEFSSMFE